MSRDGFPNSLHLLYTYGVVERIRNTVTSGDLEEFIGEMDDLFSLFVANYPVLIEYIYSGDDESARKVASCLSTIRTTALEVEDLVGLKPLKLQKVPVNPGPVSSSWKNLGVPKIKEFFSPPQHSDKSIGELQKLLGRLLSEMDLMKTVVFELTPFGSYPYLLCAPSLHRMTQGTGASCRYYGQIWSLPDGETIVGLDSKKEEIIQWILHDNQLTKFISIEGEAGAGKTTLAKMIYNEASFRASANFDLILWALAPQTSSDVSGTLVKIISSSTNQSWSDLQRMEEQMLKKKLHDILADQKYLLVLDDYREVCGGELMEILKIGLGGSAVILGSAEPVSSIATKKWVLQGLSEGDSWSLFARSAGFDEEREKENPSFMTRIGRSISQNCQGCPQAIKTLGSLLLTNSDEISWRGVKDRLTHNKHETGSALNAFNASIEQMSASLLHCLYVSSILSNSNAVPKDQLIFSWMALGLLYSRDETRDSLVIGNKYCDELASRCIVQLFHSDGHPMVQLNQKMTSLQEIFRHVEFASSTSPISQYCRHLIWSGDQSSMDRDLDLIFSTVTTFRFQSHVGTLSKKFLKKLISRMKYARVLLLEGSEFEELPVTIETLKLLKYLSLAGNAKIRALPNSICNLPNLQTLDLSGCCELQKFPRNMPELASLRHLFLSTSLTKLPELPWASLHHLRICNSPKLSSLPEQIPPSTLKVLQIHDCPEIASLPDRLLEGLSSLQEISILNCKLLDLTNCHGFRDLRRLEYLQIRGLPKLSRFPEGLHSLKHFVVSNCGSLMSLPEDLQSCRNLVEMVIENCFNLATLPKGIQEMPLQVLRIIKCPKVFARCKRGVGEDWHLISHIPKIQLDHQVYQPGYLPENPETVKNSIAGTSSQHEAHDSSEISEITSDKVQAKTGALKSKSPSCHNKNFECSKAVALPYTYGVLKRICYMATSLAVKEYVKDLSAIFSEFRSVYPILYSGDAEGEATCLDRLRTVAYDTEDLVAINLLCQQNLPSTGPGLRMYSRSLADSIAELKGSFCALADVVQFQASGKNKPEECLFDPDKVGASSLLRGASCRHYGGIWSLPDSERIIGLDSKKEEIIQWIFGDNHSNRPPKVISIRGKPGVGKTTLAKMIYNDASFQASASFDLLLWALAPPTPSELKSTLVEIIRFSTTNQSRSYLQRMEVQMLKDMLQDILSGRKYLLVLDVNSTDGHLCPSDWAELCQIFAVGLAGSTVITTASTNIATKCFKVKRLQEDQCWSLFAQSAGFKEEEEENIHPPFLTSIGKSLVGSCKRNPGKIKTLGSLLRNNRDELSWKKIQFSRMQQPQIERVFEISAKHMSCDLLHCLYLSIYLYACTRENVISRDKMIHCWMAMDLLHSTDKTEDPVDIGNRYCEELASRCFFQLFQIDGLPMVLLLKQDDMFGRILPEIEFLSHEDHGLYRFQAALPPYEVRLVSENKQSVIWHEQIGEVPKMFQLKSHLGKHFLKKLISRMKYARVLLLDGSEIEELPVTIGTLKLLKYLSLAGNVNIKALPDSVWSLPNLQTLDLSGCCELQRFPRNTPELASLRHLFLSTSLTELPELPWASLHHLRICNSPKLSSLPEQIPPSTLKVLQIHDCPEIASLPDKLLEGLSSIQEITILNCKLLDLTNWSGFRDLSRLEYLQIRGLPKLSRFPEGLHSLKHFVVSNCGSLMSLPEDLQSCRNLVEMVIENCSNLAILPKGISKMPIQVLKIIDCPKLITRCKRGVGDDWHLISHIPKIQLDHQIYQPGTSEKVEYSKVATSSQEKSHDSSEISEITSDKVQAKTGALKSKSPSCHNKNFECSKAVALPYTYGVLKRICYMATSLAVKEYVKDLSAIFSEFRSVYPILYSGDAEGEATCLDRLRTVAYDTEDLVAINLLCQQNLPSTGPGLRMYSRSLADSIAELKGSFCALADVVQFQASGKNKPEECLFDPDKVGASSLLRGASCRHYGGIWSLPDSERIIGLDSKKEEIIQWIFGDNHSNRPPKVISIRGKPGVGKTTLAKMIYNDASFQASASFDLLLWALAPPTPSELKSTLVEIIRFSTTNQSRSYLQRMEVQMLKDMLQDILSGRKYLLVLDVNSTDGHLCPSDWAELCQIFAVGLAGSTVITTASTNIATKCFKVKRLQEDQCWSLFAQSAGFKEEEEENIHPPFLTSIGKSLVGSCKRNPGKIKTLGSLLRNNRDELSWKKIQFSRMQQPQIEIFSATHMSCDLLHCLYLSIYLYICTRDNVISRDKLIHCWMAMDLLHAADKTEDPVDIGNRYCEELVSRCFFQFFQTDGLPMVLLLKQDEMFNTVLPKIEFLPYEDHKYARCQPALPPYAVRLVSENKHSVIWHEQIGEVPEMFQSWSHFGINLPRELISRMKCARVLLLDGSEFEKLPETVGTLKLLKYLSLAGNVKITALPDSVWNLPNLQTLDLSGCSELQRFPQNMHQLVSLRHLFLSTSLTKLPELPWASLHHLRICNSPKLSSLPEQIPPSTLKVLQIHDCPEIASLPDRLLEGLSSLQEISILNCKLLDLTNCHGFRDLRRLEYLQIRGLPKLSRFPEGLHSLKHFVVSNCESLMSQPEDLHSCRNLVEMVIENCSNLATLPKGISEMPLQVLKIIKCPKLITRCIRGVGDDWHLISHIPKTQLDHQVCRPDKESKDPRSIFFLLPEDYEIEKDKLIQLWMAAKLITGEQHGDQLFKSFFQAGYLSQSHRASNSETRKDRYRINTQKISELHASQTCNGSYYLQCDKEYLDPSRAAKFVRHVSLGSNVEIDAKTLGAIEMFTQLKTLLFLGNHRAIQIPRSLFSVLNHLVILDLSRSYMKELPSSIADMSRLRYMDLSWTLIERLPSILCTLVQLETLKLRGCYNLTVLPEKLHQLTKLRHLDFDVLGQLEIMPPKLGELVDLRTFPAFLAGTEDGRKIIELNKMNNLSGELCIASLENVVNGDEADAAALAYKVHLKTLELRWTSSEICGLHNNSEAILDKLKPSTKLEELRITCYEGESFPCWIGDPVYCNLVTIMLYRCENVPCFPVVQKLPNLKHLRLVRMNKVKEITNKDGAAFPKLEKLEIDGMQSLENWDWKKINEGDFGSLGHLVIEDCPKLARFDVIPHLPSIRVFEIINCPMLETLSDSKLPDSIEELTIDDCPPLEQRCVHGGGDWQKIQHIPSISISGVDEHERITEGHPSSSVEDVNDSTSTNRSETDSTERSHPSTGTETPNGHQTTSPDLRSAEFEVPEGRTEPDSALESHPSSNIEDVNGSAPTK